MHSSLLSLQIKALLLLFLSSPLLSSTTNYCLDFGRIIQEPPKEVLHPKTPQEISLLLKAISSSPSQSNTTVSARGAAHSTYGQAQAPGGIIVDMQALPSIVTIGKMQDTFYVDASGGVLWVDLLKETLKQGLTPRSWTDYLYLTVGGTLSNAGISGQAFKFGPQISNVLELDVITGKGEQFTCSKEMNSDLFYGVLGGLGQFGIITRARIILDSAPKMAKRVLVPYNDFDQFTRAQELLISMVEVDYLEGSLDIKFMNSSTTERLSENDIGYKLESAIYFDDPAVGQKKLDLILSRMNVSPATANITDMSYFDFLNRVRASEEELDKQGLWEVPHPWLNLFVPRDQIGRFKDLLIETIPENATSGVILIYPTLKDKWDTETSAVLPQGSVMDDKIMYVVSVLRSAPPSCTSGSPCLESYLKQNEKIIETAAFDPSGIRAKQYLSFLKNEEEWSAHFGERWERFKELKSRFDPLNILSPGQRIFRRKPITN